MARRRLLVKDTASSTGSASRQRPPLFGQPDYDAASSDSDYGSPPLRRAATTTVANCMDITLAAKQCRINIDRLKAVVGNDETEATTMTVDDEDAMPLMQRVKQKRRRGVQYAHN